MTEWEHMCLENDITYSESEYNGININLKNIIRSNDLVLFQYIVPHFPDIIGFYKTYSAHFFEGDFKCFSHLLSLGLPMNIEDRFGNTPIFYAIIKVRDIEYRKLKFFLNKEVDFNHPNIFGDTPVLHAIKNDYLDITYWLLRHDVNIHVKNDSGKTLLHYLCSRFKQNGQWKSNKFKKCVRRLLQHGLNPYTHDYVGRKPLDYLQSSHKDQIMISSLIDKYYCEIPCIKEPNID
jgi:ankyrin repeat protein